MDWVKLAWDSIQSWASVNALTDLSISIKGSDFLDHTTYYQFLKKDYAPCSLVIFLIVKCSTRTIGVLIFVAT